MLRQAQLRLWMPPEHVEEELEDDDGGLPETDSESRYWQTRMSNPHFPSLVRKFRQELTDNT